MYFKPIPPPASARINLLEIKFLIPKGRPMQTKNVADSVWGKNRPD